MSTIEIKGKKVNYIKEGNGNTAIVMVHGWGGSHKSFRKLHCLFREDFTSVIFDLPGFGSSDKPNSDWGVREYGDFVYEFIKKLEFKKVILFGHSFGGSISIYLASKYPDLVKKLILGAPSFKRATTTTPTLTSSQLSRKTFWEKIKHFTKLPFYEALKPKIYPIRKLFYKFFYPSSEVLRFPELESNFRKIITEDLTFLLPKINISTLILWGDQDSFVPLKYAYILKAKIQNSKLKIHKGVGHGLPKFKPEWVYMEVKKFIEGK